MAYFLGAVFPLVLLVLGVILLVLGVVEPETNLSVAGAILLSGVLVAFSLGNRSNDAA
jgi:membrane-bound ClpP family serine protease